MAIVTKQDLCTLFKRINVQLTLYFHSIQLESEEIAESMKRLHKVKVNESSNLPKVTTKSHQSEETASKDVKETEVDEKSSVEKEMKKLRKKLEQIKKLKQKREEGEDMQQCQVRRQVCSSHFIFRWNKKNRSYLLSMLYKR